jgi:uncharacterized membrane protein
VFRRRSDPESNETRAQSPTGKPAGDDDRPADDAGRQAPKGRATPKRSEAEKARKERVKPPLTKRDALRKDRERMKQQRARSRRAMSSGDERYFLPRDQGPERKFLRDFVDARRTVGEFFLPLIIVILLGNFVPIYEIQLFMMTLWIVVMIMLVIDMTVMNVKAKRELRKRFPDDTRRGQGFYVVMRAMQIRRLRLPKPAVKPGDLV